MQDVQEALHAAHMSAAAAAEETLTLQGKHTHSLAQLNATSKDLTEYKLQVPTIPSASHALACDIQEG